jgi:hypothetical protein
MEFGMMKVIGVGRISDGLFSITVGNASSRFQTLCKISVVEVSGHAPVQTMEFESEEFKKMIMMGDVSIEEIRKSLKEYSK